MPPARPAIPLSGPPSSRIRSWGSARGWPAALGALTIIVGHALNIFAFIIAGLLPANQLTATVFSAGLGLEVVIDVVVISIIVPLLRPLTRPPA